MAHDIRDYLALASIISNAGGIISDQKGNPLTLLLESRFVACDDPAVHRFAMDILSG